MRWGNNIMRGISRAFLAFTVWGVILIDCSCRARLPQVHHQSRVFLETEELWETALSHPGAGVIMGTALSDWFGKTHASVEREIPIEDDQDLTVVNLFKRQLPLSFVLPSVNDITFLVTEDDSDGEGRNNPRKGEAMVRFSEFRIVDDVTVRLGFYQALYANPPGVRISHIFYEARRDGGDWRVKFDAELAK